MSDVKLMSRLQELLDAADERRELRELMYARDIRRRLARDKRDDYIGMAFGVILISLICWFSR